MTKEVAEKIVRGITDKIESNTVDIDDWAEFWGFTREEYEEFLDMAINALEQKFVLECPICGLKMTIPRPRSRKRKEGHIKTMYCAMCKETRDFIENNYKPLN